MKISVQQDWLGRYKFFTDDGEKPVYTGAGVSRVFKREYASIYDADGQSIMVIRRGSHSVWELNESFYLIDDFRSGRTFEVKCVNYKKGHWTFDYNQTSFEIFYHGRSKKSLYRNGEQVAKFVKVKSRHTIVANDDEDVLLLVALFVAFKMGDSAPDHDLILDVFGEAKEEDIRWHPMR